MIAGPGTRCKSTSKPIVKLVDVTKIYEMGHAGGAAACSSRRKGPTTTVTVHALRGVSVDFYPGEYVAIMGASGLRQEHHAQPAGLSRPAHGRRRTSWAGATWPGWTTTSSPRSAAVTSASSSSRIT